MSRRARSWTRTSSTQQYAGNANGKNDIMASNRFPDDLDLYQEELTEEEREGIAAASVALDLARLIYAAREARGLTQKEAAELTGVRQQMISRLEGGTAQPTFKTVERYMRRLGFALRLSLIDENNDEPADALVLNEGERSPGRINVTEPVLVNHR
jgi:transcriptional regulator with XRE-family HTH domain